MDTVKHHIFVVESMSAFSVMLYDPRTFTLNSPMSQTLLDSAGLVQKELEDYHEVHKDILVRRRNYKLTALDKMFIDEVRKSAAEFGMKVIK